ncbi:MAG: TIGR02300 family protein [Alphaproteobacteria bacterium]|nr:TIGR02300 family protein [Alphaproteobacteria bacterium]
MSKPEWGLKRSCQSCGARFYDLLRSPIICPKCGAEFDPLANLRPRRGRGAAESKERREREAPVAEGAALGIETEEVADADAEDEAVIEDASELGEDDVAEVIEGEADEEER